MKTSMVTCREVAGTGSAALLLFSVVYWWPKAKVTVRGKRWIGKARVSWRQEIKLSRNQFDRGLAKLKRLGVIETSSHKFAGPTPILHVRLTPSGISRLSTSPEDGPDFLESENSDFLESEKVHTQKPTIQKQKDLSSKDHGMTSSPGKEPPMPSEKDKILSSPKAEKKHMNAGACEVKPLHLQIAFRKLCAEHWPGHWTGVPSKKEWNQWKNWIKHCGEAPPRACARMRVEQLDRLRKGEYQPQRVPIWWHQNQVRASSCRTARPRSTSSSRRRRTPSRSLYRNRRNPRTSCRICN